MSCGAPLGESETFCTRCGTKCGTAAPPAQQQTQYNYNTANSPQPVSHRLTVVVVMSLIWAAFGLVVGLVLVFYANSIVDQMVQSDPSSLDVFDALGVSAYDFSVMLGTIFAVSGALAAITAALCLMKKFYIVTLVICIISAVLVIWLLIGIVGLIVAFLIYRAKHEFKGGNRNIL
ncbi:MAG: hypothetical protein FWF07_02465 [Methanomassiliicoccaceae archaeon]|nr:hypothetical protein [Methanomassiliicoccaceae archaeon]